MLRSDHFVTERYAHMKLWYISDWLYVQTSFVVHSLPLSQADMALNGTYSFSSTDVSLSRTKRVNEGPATKCICFNPGLKESTAFPPFWHLPQCVLVKLYSTS